MHTANYTLHSAHCIMNTVYCTLHNAHCILHTVPKAKLSEQKISHDQNCFVQQLVEVQKKSHIRETLNPLACADCGTNTKQMYIYINQVSGVRCHMSRVTCHMSLTPTATPTNPPPANSPLCTAGWLAKT